MHRKAGQPLGPELGLCGGPVDAWQAHHEVVADPPDRMVGSPRFDDRQRTIREVWHLGAQETTNEYIVDRDLVTVHTDRHSHSLDRHV
jgi:hypothetical protein